MSYRLVWLPKVLKEAGLKVEEVAGWPQRGHGDMPERIWGVMLHHTAGALHGNNPSLKTVVHGRQGLPGPLAQLLLARDGTYFVVAAGKCWHAGQGRWKGIVTGNGFIGIEAENTGLDNDPWPAVQYDAYVKGVRAILKHLGLGPEWAIGHKEWAPRRKIDPSFDMAIFRFKL